MTEPAQIDYRQLIADLERCRVSIYKIAMLMTHAGLATQYVQVKRWADGREPRDRQARMLLAIHAEYVPHETLQP